MPQINPEALRFLQERRSVSYKSLTGPAPDRNVVERILTAGSRVPDHKMLVPFRFIVLEKPALIRLADAVYTRAISLGMTEESAQKTYFPLANVPLSVAVIASPKSVDAVPLAEQMLTVGAVCLSVLNAALASGWGANWITGWAAFDRVFLTENLALEDHEHVAGFIHMGTAPTEPTDRKRPDLNVISSWVSE